MLALAISCAMACTGYAQQPNPQQAPATPPASGQSSANEPAKTATTPSTTAVPMTEPVITLKGACPAKAGSPPAKGCVKTLTRAQFEELTNALQPADKGPVPPEVRRRFATQYAKLLTLADAARELGLENDPKVEQIFTFARNQILAEALNQHYVQKYAHPTDQQIQEYYDQNKKKYVEATLQRIIIPMQQVTADHPKPDKEAEKAFADKIHERWVAGEDPTKLQKEAMDNSDVKTTPPDINVGARRPGSLPEAHEGVFELKVGEVSPVYSDPAAFYIYKVISMRQVPESEVKNQISQTLQRQNFSDKMQQIQGEVTPVLNDAYFGPETPSTVPQTIIHPGESHHHAPGAEQKTPSGTTSESNPPASNSTTTPPANSGTSPH